MSHSPRYNHQEALAMGEGAVELIPQSDFYCYDYRSSDITLVERNPEDKQLLIQRGQELEAASLMQVRKLCPFWGRDDSGGGYGRGICTLLNIKDDERGMLWDMLRSCIAKN